VAARPTVLGPAARPAERRVRVRAANPKARRPLPRSTVDSYARVLWWLFSSSAGAHTRGRVVVALRTEPKNAQQLATELRLDYTTVRHHLKVLQENHVIESTGAHYGQVYSLASEAEARWPELEAILRRHRQAEVRR
jgi:DNA-binding transcriptional ArsR family regulator